MRLITFVLCLTLLGSAACSRLTDVLAYETSIERVKLSNAALPEFQTHTLKNTPLIKELKAAGFTSFLWSHPGKGVIEWYPSGRSASDPVNVKSVSKALFSALVGVAQPRDTSAPISSFAGCRTPDALHPLSFDILMNMTAGFDFTENVSSDIYAAPKWGCRALQLPIDATSGTRFKYNTLQYHLAGIALAEQRGSDIASLLQKEVLGPMEIALDGWVKNSDGDVFTGSEMRLHPRDMLRFGEVYLNGGRFNGKQLIPHDWIEKSRGPQRTDTGRKGIGYSYGWWLTELAGTKVQFAEGYGGQAIIVAPEAQQVFVFTAPTGGLVSGAKHDARIAKLLAIAEQMLH